MRSKLTATFLLLGLVSSLQAGPVIYNLAFNQINLFDTVITGTGSTVSTVAIVNGQSVYNYTDKDGNPATVSVYRPGTNTAFPADEDQYCSGPDCTSGATWGINPVNSNGDPIPGFASGIEFRFSSPVNAFGFEIGDWATCCFNNVRPANIVSAYGVPASGTGLWISFDGGAFTLPANALSDSDNPGIAAGRGYVNFIGAIDSSATFSVVRFFGDGFGEYLVAGGSLRFSSVPIGSVGGEIPEPSTYMLAGLGLALLGWKARRRQA